MASVWLCAALIAVSLPAAPKTASKQITRAKKFYKALEFKKVVRLTRRILKNPEITPEERLDTYVLQGSSLAIVGRSVDAEKPFRFLLRGRPNFDLPRSTPPKILAIFRKVQMEELERQRLVKEMHLESGHPSQSTGGRPVSFDYSFRDPKYAIQSAR